MARPAAGGPQGEEEKGEEEGEEGEKEYGGVKGDGTKTTIC